MSKTFSFADIKRRLEELEYPEAINSDDVDLEGLLHVVADLSDAVENLYEEVDEAWRQEQRDCA